MFRGKVLKDWDVVDWENPTHVQQVLGALNHYCSEERPMEVVTALQQFATKGDLPDEVAKILEKLNILPSYDNGYELLFTIRDFTDTHASSFDLLDVDSGIAFSKLPTGEKMRVYDIGGVKVNVPFDTYAAALGWRQELIDDKQYWELEDGAEQMRNAAYKGRAEAFYALIEALGAGRNYAYDTIGSDVLEKDINTLNGAYLSIIESTKDTYADVTAAIQLVLLAPAGLKARILRALGELSQAFANSTQRVVYNIRPYFTHMFTESTTSMYLGLPGHKIKGGYRQNLVVKPGLSILAHTHLWGGTLRYGGAIGNTSQVLRVATV